MISERLFEVCLVAVVLVIVLIFVAAEFKSLTREAGVLALRSDLRIIRAALNNYYSRNNTYPPSIEVALREGYGKNIAFRLGNVDNRGRILDPFGSHYFYNPSTGEVRSRTRGHERCK